MLKILNVNKYFFKKKKNQIHVINNTTLNMESKGLVTLLGPSGCGKTTLLNAIGGLDKIDSGEIYVDDKKITGIRSGKIDEIRGKNIGYIFQNYNLVEEMSVFDNVAIALKLIGIKDKEEIKEKVNYVLEKVGMYRYKNRSAYMLSGGERQRVGIARAIVKNPSIIIADEPTGNLDSRNTIEIMNIIKTISKEKLVILVTHEEKLADFYASRIIRIKDGVIVSDEVNAHENNLDYRIDDNIYLKDFKVKDILKNDKYDLKIFKKEEEKLALDIVLKNGNIYIQSIEGRVEVIDEYSKVKLIDGHYEGMSKEESQNIDFDSSKLANKGVIKYSSIVNLPNLIKGGFKKVMDYTVPKKLLLVGFFVSAMFTLFAVSNLLGITSIKDEKFVEKNKDYLYLAEKNVEVGDYLKYETSGAVDYIMPGTSVVNFSLPADKYLQGAFLYDLLKGSITSKDSLKKEDLVAGRLPENPYEVVIDGLTVKKFLEDGQMRAIGVTSNEKLVGLHLKVKNMEPFTIVGVTDDMNPCVYVDNSQFLNLISNSMNEDSGGGITAEPGHSEPKETTILDYSIIPSSAYLKKGKAPENDYEVVVNIKKEAEIPLNKTIDKKINGNKLKVVGYYTDKKESDYLFVNTNTLKYNLIKNNKGVTINPQNKDKTITYFDSQGKTLEDTYAKSKENYTNNIWSKTLSGIILAFVMLGISIMEIFLIMRSSFLSRVKEVGVYRAIGVRKSDIYKMFLGEVTAITTLSSVPGLILMAYIIKNIADITYLKDMFMFNPMVIVLSFALIYVFNIFFGLLPVIRTLRKTPAEILSRTDVD